MFKINLKAGDYALDSFQRFALGGMLVLTLLTFIGANLHAHLWQTSRWLVSTVLPSAVVELTNEERADESLKPLRRSATLDTAARMKAQHMAKNEYFSHYAPDGTSPWYWFDQSGYKYVHAGENLAIHFTDSSEVVDAWMDSPTHRANIVNGNFTEIGVGTAKGTYQGYDTVYVVQLFGAPAATPVVKSAAVPTPEKPKETPVAESVAVAQEEPSRSESVLAAAEDVVTKEVTALEESSVEENVNTTSDVASSAAPLSDDVVVIESELVSTSTGLAPATSTASSTEDVQYTFGTIATKPNFLLQLVYLFLGLVVVSVLLFSVVSEVRKLHYVQAVYGVALLILMIILWYVHSLLTTGALII